MKSNTLTFSDSTTFDMALNVLALFDVRYGSDDMELTITSTEAHYIVELLRDEGITDFEFDGEVEDTEPDDSMDGDFDSAMESAGFGTDEQYEHGTCGEDY